MRNSNGEVLAAGPGNITYVASSLQVEAIAAYKNIFQTTRLGMTRIILEMTPQFLLLPSNRVALIGAIGCLVQRIRNIMHSEFSFCTASV